MDDITQRITQIIKDKKLTNASFADAIEIKRPIVSHILSGRNKPSLHVVLQILHAFPEISPSWLLLGKSQEVETLPKSTPTPEPARVPEFPFEEVNSNVDSEEKEDFPSTLLLVEGNQFRVIKKSN